MKCALSVISLALLLATAISAQNFRGGIKGVVTDESGAILPSAIVKATNEARSPQNY